MVIAAFNPTGRPIDDYFRHFDDGPGATGGTRMG
jgi:hypothetical protein